MILRPRDRARPARRTTIILEVTDTEVEREEDGEEEEDGNWAVVAEAATAGL
jgi:hypothetical protein